MQRHPNNRDSLLSSGYVVINPCTNLHESSINATEPLYYIWSRRGGMSYVIAKEFVYGGGACENFIKVEVCVRIAPPVACRPLCNQSPPRYRCPRDASSSHHQFIEWARYHNIRRED